MAQGQLDARAECGPYHGVVETLEESLLGLVREAAKAHMGSFTDLLDLTPYQLLRLLGAKPKASTSSSGALAKLRRLQGDH